MRADIDQSARETIQEVFAPLTAAGRGVAQVLAPLRHILIAREDLLRSAWRSTQPASFAAALKQKTMSSDTLQVRCLRQRLGER